MTKPASSSSSYTARYQATSLNSASERDVEFGATNCCCSGATASWITSRTVFDVISRSVTDIARSSRGLMRDAANGATGWEARPARSKRRQRRPGGIGVVLVHLLELLERRIAEILLVHDAVVAHEERLHPGHEILRRRRNQGEAADHRAVHHEVHRSHGCVRPLLLQDLEEVAVVRKLLVRVAL